MGSKSKVLNGIRPIIQQKINEYGIKTYIEPFCGGCNVISEIDCENKIASDIHKYLVELFVNMDKVNTLPEFVTKEHYSQVRECFNKKTNIFPNWYIGAIGFLASYNGRFFDGGYAGVVQTKAGTTRNYYDEAKRNLLKQIQSIQGTIFKCGDYEELYKDCKNCLFYCDIPYKETKQYGINKKFDYDRFWNWAKEMSKENIVIVSECVAPSEWRCIWQQKVKRTINNAKRVNAIEKMFEYKIELLEA